jgi:N-terminal acetyltransferase B complex non-catalytic subunit
VDKRDFKYYPSYREDDAQLLSRYRCGPLPKKLWIDSMIFRDNVATYLKAELTSNTTSIPESLKERYDAINQQEESLTHELSPAERSSGECHKLIYRLAIAVKCGMTPQEEFDNTLEHLQTWLDQVSDGWQKQQSSVEQIADIAVPTWTHVHTCLTQLETLQLVSMLVAVLALKAKAGKGKGVVVPKEKVAELGALVSQAENAIHGNAKAMKEHINAPGVLGQLVDLGMARVSGGKSELTVLEGILDNICDEVTIETICGRWKESWEDALDGVLAVKVRTYK